MITRLARLLAALLLATLSLAAGSPVVSAAPAITVEPTTGPAGAPVTIRGVDWPAGRMVTVSIGRTGAPLERWLTNWLRGSVKADGTLLLTGTIPKQYETVGGAQVSVAPGDYSLVVATDSGGDGAAAGVGQQFTVTPARPPGPPTINWRFADYYYGHDGGRLLGNPISDVRFEGPLRVQYFEKGRIEDHAGQPGAEGAWRFLYGRLAAELAEMDADLPVGGERSTLTYAALHALMAPEHRLPAPDGWSGVSPPADGGSVFVPVDSALAAAPGHLVPARFWAYINQPALFPAGWAHDVGLPLTEAVTATVTKVVDGRSQERRITVQLFERTVLTDDLANPEGWQIERANVGSDFLLAHSGEVIPGDVALLPDFTWIGPTTTEQNLPDGMAGPAWEWRSQFNTTIQMEDEIGRLRQILADDGWTVLSGPAGGFAMGSLVAVKVDRMQVVNWWLGASPTFPPDRPELGTQMRVVVGPRA